MIRLPEIEDELHDRRAKNLQGVHVALERADTDREAGSTCSLTRSIRRDELRIP
jgi:hypothetical protein